MNLPKLPDSILVLGIEFRVELIPDLLEKEECHGMTIGMNHCIQISSALDTQRQWQTLLHEYVHAVLHVIGLGNNLNDDVEEVIAQSMEYAMVLLLRQHGETLTKISKGGK